MKKIVKLTESDIVRLVKKVINENKKLIKENPAYLGGMNNDIQNLKAVQWSNQIEVEFKSGYRKNVSVYATIDYDTGFGSLNLMRDKPVTMYDMWGENGGIGADIATGKCDIVGIPACLTRVQLNSNEAYDLTQKLKSGQTFTTYKKGLYAVVDVVGKVQIDLQLTIK
jgi:hypothetical protein